MDKVLDKKFVVIVNNNGKELYYKCIEDGENYVEDGELVLASIRTDATHFKTYTIADVIAKYLKSLGYECRVDEFYMIPE